MDKNPMAQTAELTLPTLRLDQHPTIPSLYQTYNDGFKQLAPKALQLQRAKDLALALLQHYYPKSQGFTVEPTEPLNIARHGWNFWLAPHDYNPQDKKSKLPTYHSPFEDKQHHIRPEHITSFRVVSEQEFYNDSDDATANPEEHDDLNRDQVSADTGPPKQRPTTKKPVEHTYLTILLDDLSTFPRWVPDSLQQSNDRLISNPRHDILRYALGVVARIQKGYGFLLLGPRLEAYTYEWQDVAEDGRAEGARTRYATCLLEKEH
ncbi:hypothetical protein DM02DRAFT_213069 [Periconia macrospinosa]|uniref:Uncharacterized protein n=1 Tax=Periconia macrospinosa TaxID=97972 RepID=A0A2V1E0F3_9PLEO|nr:hypothetical protein DM02DRAFT_213069 [Periconia macrospinosa]